MSKMIDKYSPIFEMLRIYQEITHHKWYLYAFGLFFTMCVASALFATFHILSNLMLIISLGILSVNIDNMLFSLICYLLSALLLICTGILIYTDAEAMRLDDRIDIKVIGLKYGYMPKINEYGYED